MNIENLKKLRDAVANSRAFNMEEWPDFDICDAKFINGHYCGTPACIGGHASALILREKLYGESTNYTYVFGWLELDNDQSADLFFPDQEHNGGIVMRNIDQAHAVRCLDHLIETGEVDWMATS